MASAPEMLDAAPEIRIRPMTEADVSEVFTIERASYQFPWSEGIFRDCLRVGYVCRVLTLESQVIGYGVMSVGAGEAHVLNLCVADGDICNVKASGTYAIGTGLTTPSGPTFAGLNRMRGYTTTSPPSGTIQRPNSPIAGDDRWRFPTGRTMTVSATITAMHRTSNVTRPAGARHSRVSTAWTPST